MRKLLLFFLLLTSSFSFAQIGGHIEVNKSPGQPTTISFWQIPDPTTFDGIAVESSTAINGTFTDMPLTILKTDVKVTFPAPSVPTFYRIYFYKMINGVKTKSLSSNLVAVNIVLSGIPAATGS